MKTVSKFDTVATIWKIADIGLQVGDVSGVAVETVDVDGTFDGTIVYFPGLHHDEVGRVLHEQEEEEEEEKVDPVLHKIGTHYYCIELDADVILAQVSYDEFTLIDLENGNRLNEPVHVLNGAWNGLTQQEFDSIRGGLTIEAYEEEA